MRKFQGIPVSPGIAQAPAFWLRTDEAMPLHRAIAPKDIEAERERFRDALEAARDELDEMSQRAGISDAVGSIAAGHREFLRDPTLLAEVDQAIEQGPSAADYAVATVFRRWVAKFKAMQDEFFRQRYVDLVDLERRVLRHLRPETATVQPTPDQPAVLVAHDLTPSEAIELDRKSFVGFVTEQGGATSHTAIIAKSLGLPAICGLGPIGDTIAPGTPLIVDGMTGRLIVDPDRATTQRYKERAERLAHRFRILKRLAELPAETPDGWTVEVHANIEFPFEVEQAVQYGADGIGLYRTEFLYAENKALPDEEAHLRAYREALDALKGRPLTIRTFDFGADKFADELDLVREPNPFLGCRSIRYSFARPELFRTQLRAILRASAEGPVKILFPMISSVTEMRRAKSILHQVQEELRRERIPFDADVNAGAMIEIPSAAVASDLLARECDFLSLGTNDLTQYTLAVDRTNDRVAALFRPSNPAILRLLRMVARQAELRGIPLSMCGEMGAERAYTLLLLGLGIRNFSVAPSAVPEVKRVVRAVTRRRAAEITEQALPLPTPEEVDAYLHEQADRFVPEQ